MTEISFPPLHELPPGELARRKQHLLSEIRREPEWRLPTPSLRFAVPAAAAVGIAAVCAVVFSGAFGGSGGRRPGQTAWNAYVGEATFPFLTTKIDRSGQAVASVKATVQAPWPGATAQIYVLRNPNYAHVHLLGGRLVTGPRGGQIVYQAETSLTNPNSRPTTPADDRWSSTVTLKPSRWDGGCRNAPYVVYVLIGNPSDPKRSAESGSAFFTCNRGVAEGSR
jgi:hypothetical protein